MRPPPSPERHVSTARLATTKASREAAHHHNSQARNGMPPHTHLVKIRIAGHMRRASTAFKKQSKKSEHLALFKKALWHFSALKKYLKN
jgi:hypothetical protein